MSARTTGRWPGDLGGAGRRRGEARPTATYLEARSLACPDNGRAVFPTERPASAKTQRIEIRVTDEERGLERAAAAARGQTLSELVRQAARREADEATAEQTSIVLNAEEAGRFLAALDDPASFEAGLGALTEKPSVLGG